MCFESGLHSTRGSCRGVDLFLIDPVQLAVVQLRAAVGREPALAPVIDVHHVQVVAAQEAHQLAVRAEVIPLLPRPWR